MALNPFRSEAVSTRNIASCIGNRRGMARRAKRNSSKRDRQLLGLDLVDMIRDDVTMAPSPEARPEMKPALTYEELAQRIAAMTPEQRRRPAVVAMQNTGEVAGITDIVPIEEFNGVELPNQMAVWYDNHSDPPIH